MENLSICATSIGELFAENRQLALQEAIDRYSARAPYQARGIFCWQSTRGVDGVRYGSFRFIAESEIQARSHVIEYMDGSIGIFWTDVLFDKLQNLIRA